MTGDGGFPDAGARDRIRGDHDTTLIVEAAAGTGKTTAVVSRVVELIAVGRARVGQIAAITFTEKAGGELRLRIRQGLETRIEAEGQSGGDPAVRERLETALSKLEEAPIGTIHAFCATMLQEHPVAAGVDPDFGILSGPEQRAFFERVFQRFLERQLEEPGPGVARLLRRNHNPWESPVDLLREAGRRLLDYRTLDAPWERRPWDPNEAARSLVHDDLEPDDGDDDPEKGPVPSLNSIEALYRSLPREPPGRKPNWLAHSMGAAADLAREIRVREAAGGGDPAWVEQALACLRMQAYRGPIPPGAPKETRELRDGFRERLEEFRVASNADLAALLREDLRDLVERYEWAKRKAGMLDFDDLLHRARDLLADSAGARAELRDRFRQILVDEYQDTDPLQTEILLLLTAEDPPGGDWKRAVPIPGRLCLVGDPKQSIYRFRRAEVRHYLEVKKRLLAGGAAEVRLTTNFRSTPDICDFVNRVMEPVFRTATGVEPPAQQVPYSPLHPFREAMPGGAPSLAPIPITGATTVRDLERQEPEAVAEFVRRLLESDFRVSSPDGAPRPVEPGDICLLFRRFRGFRGKLVPKPVADALRDRGIPHSLAAVQSYVGSAEISAMRAVLAAIEYPDDELSVYATLRGPLFSIPDQDLFLFRERRKEKLQPSRAAPPGPEEGSGEKDAREGDARDADRAILDSLRFLFRLHRRRNRRPIAETLQELLGAHRAETAFAFWTSRDQVLSNLRRLLESARAFEAAGGISFRGFVEQLTREAENPDFGAAHAMDEDVRGVRIMTVHAAKGLEFPVVVLCDAALSRTGRASRIVRPERGLHACDLGPDLRPWDLLEDEATEAAEDLAELDRLLYVAMTRARDLLAAPVFELRYPDRAPSLLDPASAGLASLFPRGASGSPIGSGPAAPGARDWRRGARQWDLLQAAGASGNGGAADPGERAEAAFLAGRRRTIGEGRIPERRTRTAKAVAELPPTGENGRTNGREATAEAVETHSVGRDPDRPRGADFGRLVHRVLERAPLDGDEAAARLEAERAARELDLPAAFAAPAAEAALAGFRHELLDRAREAAARGACYRELPLLHREEAGAAADRMATPGEGPETGASPDAGRAGEDPTDPDPEEPTQAAADGATLVEGVADLVFRTAADGPWTVVDFKTDFLDPGDAEARETEARYRRQVSLYARAVSRATGAPAKAALLFV